MDMQAKSALRILFSYTNTLNHLICLHNCDIIDLLNQLNTLKNELFCFQGGIIPFFRLSTFGFDKNANPTCRKQISSVVFKLV